MAIATFGAGCFWGVEELFRTQKGVEKTSVGYMGGTTDKPTYKEVCTGTTNHAEVVQIHFNPDEISYEELVILFFESHDPTQLNRQGPDHGTQYRSVIFYEDEQQKETAVQVKDQLDNAGQFSKPIVTIVEEVKSYWPAEDYHQKYLLRRGLTTCHI